MSGLSFGPLDQRAFHVCIDMQRIFLEPGPWFGAAGLAILPNIARLSDHAPKRSLFTRFITAKTAAEAPGTWQRYYTHWSEVTQEKAGGDILDLHGELAPRAMSENVFDKPTHDSFHDPAFAQRLDQEAPSALIFSGVETDVCVLATALTAVDLGHRVVIATDAVASSSEASHQACLDLVYPRFDQQIELATTDEILSQWVPS